MTVWFDVEDLIQYFQTASHPTGIQRLSFETYRAVWHQAGASGEVRFCRRAGRTGFRSIHFPALEAGILAAAAQASAAPLPGAPGPRPPSRLTLAARRLPLRYQAPLGAVARGAASAIGGFRDLAAAAWRPGLALRRGVGGHQFELNGAEIRFESGDWLVNLGAPWTSPYCPEFLSGLRAGGCGLALIAYDLIPKLFPEWCTARTVGEYTSWLQNIVPRADIMFAISHCTARDLVCMMQKLAAPVSPPIVLPIGSDKPSAAVAAPLLENPYVLMVGTIEARKNHIAMMRVWRRMLETMPEASVPSLVFAGKRGWLTADLLLQLENANWLNGKIRFIESPSESQLASLYQHCQFTVFPSFYEGLGLPVTESLSWGKTVVASNRSSIPEAGGDFCTYFDPDNINDAYEAILGLIECPARVAGFEARIAAEFQSPSWDDTAAVLLAQFGLEEIRQCPATGLQSIT